MMKSSSLVVKTGPTSFSVNESGLVTGEIWFQSESEYFPDTVWSDFPVIILSWWCEACLRWIEGRDQSVKMSFMDGPYYVFFEAQSENDEIVGRFIERVYREGEEIEFVHNEFRISSITELVFSIEESAREALKFCDSNECYRRDVDVLRRAHESLLTKIDAI